MELLEGLDGKLTDVLKKLGETPGFSLKDAIERKIEIRERGELVAVVYPSKKYIQFCGWLSIGACDVERFKGLYSLTKDGGGEYGSNMA